MEKYTPLIGRILLSTIFIMSGAGKIFDWSGTAGYMAAYGMPAIPLFLIGAIVLEIGGGLSVLLGFKAKLGAIALLIFIIPVTLIFHNFLPIADPMAQKLQMIMFLKNLAIMGGLLLVVSFGSGHFSVGKKEA
ncbi:MAG: DoxX family protein [Nitrospinota bacterium]